MSTKLHNDVLRDGSELKESGSAWPLLLTRERAWLVRSGAVDVFATALFEDQPVGPRIHLARVRPGQLLIGSGAADGAALLGIAAPRASLAEFPLEGPAAIGTDPVGTSALPGMLERWIEVLYRLITPGPMPDHCLGNPGQQLDVGPNVCVRPSVQLAWLHQVEGSSRLIGRQGCVIGRDTIIPLAGTAWVETVEPSILRVRDTADLVARGHLHEGVAWEGVQRLQAMALRLAADRLREHRAGEEQRLRRRYRNRQVAMTQALSRLAHVMDTVEEDLHADSAAGTGDDEARLLAAFRLVASTRAVQAVDLRAARDAARSKDPINGLARAFRVRVRRVALSGEWWKTDSGPILARLSEGRRPVALLPRRGGGYELVDPDGHARTRVDAKVASTLSHFGFTVYQPLGAAVVDALGLLRFGLHGRGADLAMIAVVTLLMALLGLVTPLAIGVLYDVVIPSAARGQLLHLTGFLAVTALGIAALQAIRGLHLLRAESKIEARTLAAVWDRLLMLPARFFRQFTAGDLAVRVMGIEEMRDLVSRTAVTLLAAGAVSLLNLALLLHYHSGLALLALGLLLLALSVSLAISYLQLGQHRQVARLRARTAGLVLQLLTGIGKLKVHGAETFAFGVWARAFGEQRGYQFRTRRLADILAVFNAGYPAAATLILFAVAAPRIGAGMGPAHAAVDTGGAVQMTVGQFLGFLTAFNIALSGMLSSSTALVGALAAVPLYEQIRPVLVTRPESRTRKHDPGQLSGAIDLENVSFRYDPDGPRVLRDVSICARPGEFIALVGPSGSGKSTILRLLLGFETPESGTVRFDGHDLRSLDIESVRRQIGVVLQSGRVMSGDILRNIVGPWNATIEDAWHAARLAGLEDDIRELPMGMHTIVNDQGSTLSGGQRQRLLIARALVHRPRIVFFDEATSALDNRTQAIVHRSLEQLKVTRFTIAHRLSTIRNADRIYVMDAGRVVENGTYEELVAQRGLFYELTKRQVV